MSEETSRDDLAAAIGARRELGKEYEDAVVDSFVARLDQRIAERVDEQLAERLGSKPTAKAPASAPAKEGAAHSFILGMASLFAGSQSPRCLQRLPAPKDCSCRGPESPP